MAQRKDMVGKHFVVIKKWTGRGEAVKDRHIVWRLGQERGLRVVLHSLNVRFAQIQAQSSRNAGRAFTLLIMNVASLYSPGTHFKC